MEQTQYNMSLIPDSILNDLRCSKCREFLSCGPVTILATGGSLCGRCYIQDANTFRAVAYEAVAAYFLFRCKNWAKHCAYLLNWNDVRDHEENCVFGSCCSTFCNNPAALFKSDNKLDFTQEITVYNIPEPVLEMLTCSLCEYYLCSTPIFVSADGKSVCHRCYAVKNSTLPNNYIRHAALEKILTLMLFPCVFRHRGCTKFFRFGSDTTLHENDCSYGQAQKKPLKRYTEGKKERGVIETHSGHIFGTITPNSQFFVAQEKVTTNNSFRVEPIKVMPNEAQGYFFKQLMNHRENLVENRWKNSKLNDDVFYQPTLNVDSSYNERSENYNNNISHYNNYTKPNQLDFNQRQVSRHSSVTREPSFNHRELRNDFYPDEGFNSIDSDTRRFHSYNSESSKTDGSPRSSVFQSSPIRLNPGDLNSFNNFDRFEQQAQRQDSVLSDRNRSSLNHNGSFRY